MRARPTPSQALIACALACVTQAARAQVVINELLENPPGAGATEREWEFIELYGKPNLDLTGFALVVVKGGTDRDHTGTPEVPPEIDEAYSLDGYTLGPDGFFTLYNVGLEGTSELRDRYITPASHASSFVKLAIPSEQAPDRLDHDGSSTYLLLYARPSRPASPGTQPRDTHAAPAPNHPYPETFRKGVLVDDDFDGQIDTFGQTISGPVRLRPYQVADEIAWSNRAGREYTLYDDNELSETHGLNPDALARVAYFPHNPMRGNYTRDKRDAQGNVTGFEVRTTSTADESFVYGVLDTEAFPQKLAFFAGFDLEGWKQLKAPTDPNAIPVRTITRDPEPDTDPFAPAPIRGTRGEPRFADLDAEGFLLTPGGPNDHPQARILQQRFVEGDLDFDGRVTQSDVAIAKALLGASLYDRLPPIGDEAPDYRWQGPAFQQVLALASMDQNPADPPHLVTEADVAAVMKRASRGTR